MRRLGLLLLASCAAAPKSSPTPVCPVAAAPPPAEVAAPKPKEEPPSVKLSAEDALVRIVKSRDVPSAWFAKAFTDHVRATEVTKLVGQLEKDLGGFVRVEKDGNAWKTVYANAVVPTRIHLDDEGKVDGLWFGSPELTKARPLADVIADVKKLPGKTSVLVMTGTKVDGELAPDAALAVGSAFKLAILAALQEQVAAKKHAWTDIVKLEPRHKSLPSGFLHTWPDGAPLTLHTAASLMISQSDNTATDLLLDVASRPAVEKLAPGNAPFLATRDAFVLKAKGGADLLAKWRAGDEGARRKLLADIAKAPTPAASDFSETSTSALDVEWRFDAKHLCDLLGRTKTLPMLHINPGVAKNKDWDSIAFKGGSEPGVLNLSTLVTKGNVEHCVVATWNDDKPVEESKLLTLYSELLSAVR